MPHGASTWLGAEIQGAHPKTGYPSHSGRLQGLRLPATLSCATGVSPASHGSPLDPGLPKQASDPRGTARRSPPPPSPLADHATAGNKHESPTPRDTERVGSRQKLAIHSCQHVRWVNYTPLPPQGSATVGFRAALSSGVRVVDIAAARCSDVPPTPATAVMMALCLRYFCSLPRPGTSSIPRLS